ncbi:MAG TPA: ABC transporter ATP-binding protein [Thermoclostridium caenicola]|uniref:ABC transporter ATP-binding protein n=1 Tax=Thermoclostridium caenicola TaxID=659425 RepID=UPI002BB50678|nr:ABC transporter ATP-binding protein [Thermoclostridium caenicola]HOK43346.1 ABC transporter ATP-binding protein [Thermoclostridium caenicola]HOL84734.1 ABC transporter ATP-binding protein [Thermoclostridium caenicola]HPO77952.1 ABC transporter ATP-binding protein [Thermoclostridium caenicola]
MIEVRDLKKSFGDFWALNGVNISVPRGSVYGLVGPNGAGKTTLIKHLAGVFIPDSGTITIDGQPSFENVQVKSRVVYIPDDIYFFPQATLLDMKKFYQSVYPLFDEERFKKLHEVFPFDPKRSLRRLSRGMKKQAAFWLGICLKPDLMLLDEPVDGLDPVMRRKVWSVLLQDVAERNMTVFVSSHNLRELEDVCDHVGIMHEGRIILERNLSEIQNNIIKLQVAFDGPLPEEMNQLDILNRQVTGRVWVLIVRGDRDRILSHVGNLNPIIMDALPLTLEEIFVYELGGMNYAVKNIIL